MNNTDWVTITTTRGKIHCKALVTDRVPARLRRAQGPHHRAPLPLGPERAGQGRRGQRPLPDLA